MGVQMRREDITGMHYAPSSVRAAIQRVAAYVRAMDGREMESITMNAADYDAVLRAALKHARAHSLPMVAGLTYGGTQVSRK